MGIPGYKLQLMRHHRPSVMRQPTPGDLAGLGGQTAALCEMTRQVLNRLDALIAAITGSPLGSPEAFERGVLTRDDTLIDSIRLSMASVPITHEVVQVAGGATVAITPIIRNTGERPIPFMITNNDNAQFLRWGSETLTPLNGAILRAETTIIVRVLPSSTVYAIFPTFTKTVSVSRLGIP